VAAAVRRSQRKAPLWRGRQASIVLSAAQIPATSANNELCGAHRPRRIGLRPSDAQHRRQRGSAGGQMQKFPAGGFHFEPPSHLTSFDHLVGAARIAHSERLDGHVAQTAPFSNLRTHVRSARTILSGALNFCRFIGDRADGRLCAFEFLTFIESRLGQSDHGIFVAQPLPFDRVG
jgi:hypothetical protein